MVRDAQRLRCWNRRLAGPEVDALPHEPAVVCTGSTKMPNFSLPMVSQSILSDDHHRSTVFRTLWTLLKTQKPLLGLQFESRTPLCIAPSFFQREDNEPKRFMLILAVFWREKSLNDERQPEQQRDGLAASLSSQQLNQPRHLFDERQSEQQVKQVKQIVPQQKKWYDRWPTSNSITITHLLWEDDLIVLDQSYYQRGSFRKCKRSLQSISREAFSESILYDWFQVDSVSEVTSCIFCCDNLWPSENIHVIDISCDSIRLIQLCNEVNPNLPPFGKAIERQIMKLDTGLIDKSVQRPQRLTLTRFAEQLLE